MSIELIEFAIAVLLATALLGWFDQPVNIVKAFFLTGVACLILASVFALPNGSGIGALFKSAADTVEIRLDPSAAWLLGWGLVPAFFAGASLGRVKSVPGWFSAASLLVIGAVGVATFQDGVMLVIAWETMSLSAAYLLFTDRLSGGDEGGRAGLYMLTLLETGSVALMAGIAVLGSGGLSFMSLSSHWQHMEPAAATAVGMLFFLGFGAKLGILPFYEWFPGAYASGSGASGAMLSGAVLNVAWFGLGRALLHWMGQSPHQAPLGILVMTAGFVTSILSILYAFQQNDWRRLLSFSTAENAGLAVTVLGASMTFAAYGNKSLATLAWTVGLIHLGGHSLAKGAMMLSADHVYETTGSYQISQRHSFSKAPWVLGAGTVLAGMSLSAMPPTAGFVSEWYIFQTIFHGFELPSLAGRLALAIAGAGVALTAAIALATMIKVIGIGMLGRHYTQSFERLRPSLKDQFRAGSIFTLGILTLLYAVLMTWLVQTLKYASWPPQQQTVARMTQGALLVPLSSGFAFISPLMLTISGLALALIPFALIRVRRNGLRPYRKVPVWAQGKDSIPEASAPTGLAFSNALRQFYSFVYRPKTITNPEGNEKGYFVKSLTFEYSEAPIFGPALFGPLVRAAKKASSIIARIQTGSMNAYLAYLGLVLLAVFLLAIWQ